VAIHNIKQPPLLNWSEATSLWSRNAVKGKYTKLPLATHIEALVLILSPGVARKCLDILGVCRKRTEWGEGLAGVKPLRRVGSFLFFFAKNASYPHIHAFL